jgi:hypothetical protein
VKTFVPAVDLEINQSIHFLILILMRAEII